MTVFNMPTANFLEKFDLKKRMQLSLWSQDEIVGGFRCKFGSNKNSEAKAKQFYL